jgi:CRP-like cAMP-binding protein
MILHQGELGSAMYFLIEGAVEVLKEGNDKPVAVLGPGNLFGEMALILSEPRIASVRAKSDCRLLMLERNDFNQVVAGFPELTEHLRKLARERKALTHGFNHQKQQEVMRKVKARMAMGKLQELAFFKNVNEELLETLADAMRPVAFMPRHVIFAQNESGEMMYFITRGQVDVLLGDEPVATLQAGDVFGEMSLLFDQPRSATIRTDNYCQCFELDRQVFDHIAGQFPDFQNRLRQLAAQRSESNQDVLERLQQSQAASAALDAAYAAAAAEFDAVFAGAEVIGSSPHRMYYLVSPRSEQLIALDGEGQIHWRAGRELGLFRPFRVHVEDDVAWVVDTGHDRILVVDLTSREVLREFGNHLLPLMHPRSAVPTPQGNLLIADEGHQRLVLAGPQGNYLWEYNAPHDILSPFYAEQTPVGTFLFCDTALHMVFEIEPSSKEVLWSYGSMLIAGDGPNELNEPCCVRRLPNGSTLIADTGNHRLLLVSPKGQLLKEFIGSQRMPLVRPVHCEILPNGEVLVWSGDTDEIIRLDLAGQPAWRARVPEMAPMF